MPNRKCKVPFVCSEYFLSNRWHCKVANSYFHRFVKYSAGSTAAYLVLSIHRWAVVKWIAQEMLLANQKEIVHSMQDWGILLFGESNLLSIHVYTPILGLNLVVCIPSLLKLLHIELVDHQLQFSTIFLIRFEQREKYFVSINHYLSFYQHYLDGHQKNCVEE